MGFPYCFHDILGNKTMKTLSQDVLQMLDEGRLIIRGMIRFDFTNTYGFWTDRDDLVYNGVTYKPGSIIEVTPLTSKTGMEAQSVEISLVQDSERGLTPNVLASIESEVYHQKPVTISDAFFHPRTNALVHVEPLYRGYVDTVEHKTGANGRLIMHCESRALDNVRTGYRVRSTADQQLISPDDQFFQYVESAQKEEYYWGATKKQS